MEFRIADTFTDSLARLSGQEQKRVKTTAFDLQLNPAHPSMKFHKLGKARDKNFWSIRVSRDLRMIVHKTSESLLLCYVGHHDPAYRWAEKRKLEVHPRTGAAQLVEIRETVREEAARADWSMQALSRSPDPNEELFSPTGPGFDRLEDTVGPASAELSLFANQSDDDLLGFGVPLAWLPEVRLATEESLLEIADHLPAEAAEALLELATGSEPVPTLLAAPGDDPFEHPDALRRFRVMADADELERALDAPWEKWTIFLHPAQRELVERDFAGPARVSGSAGTGKTIVALHRAVHLATKHASSRVLLTTYSDTLANALRIRLRRLLHDSPMLGERLEVASVDEVARRLLRSIGVRRQIASDAEVRAWLREIPIDVPGARFTADFVWTEWKQVIDAWQIQTWADYRDVKRLGRRTRLSESQRAGIWAVVEQLRRRLEDLDRLTRADAYGELTRRLEGMRNPPFDFAVVDESQDLGVPELRFLAALGANRPNGLFFAGDLGQRIFQQPFSWRSLGVDIRGRSSTLRINYRTSHQIRAQSDRLLDEEIADVDGNAEKRRGTVSVFNGPEPRIEIAESSDREKAIVAQAIREWHDDGIAPGEIAIFVRSSDELPRAIAAVGESGLEVAVMDERMSVERSRVVAGTMNLAKGLEYRAVIVMACDDDVLPLQARVESVADEADLDDVYQTERHLLYVACTRARDRLFVTGVEPATEFLEDLLGGE